MSDLLAAAKAVVDLWCSPSTDGYLVDAKIHALRAAIVAAEQQAEREREPYGYVLAGQSRPVHGSFTSKKENAQATAKALGGGYEVVPVYCHPAPAEADALAEAARDLLGSEGDRIASVSTTDQKMWISVCVNKEAIVELRNTLAAYDAAKGKT